MSIQSAGRCRVRPTRKPRRSGVKDRCTWLNGRQGQRRKAGSLVTRKTATKTTDKIEVAGADLRTLAKHLAGFRIDQVQTTPGGDVSQATQVKGCLSVLPVSRADQRLCDEKPKAPEELLVEDFVTPRSFPAVALYLEPHKVAQHRTGSFIAALAGLNKALPKLGITGEGSVVHHHGTMMRRLD